MVTLTTALVRSCNTVFAELGMDLGAAALVNQARAFGFNEIPAADFDIVASAIPTAEDFGTDLAALAQSAIGERDVKATPLQMALVAAAVANGGEIMEPYIVAEVFASDASIEETAVPAVSKRAMSPATAEALAAMMQRVVSNGTGTAASVDGQLIAGKTGTAEVPGSDPHVWFIGFGSVDASDGAQQIAIAVMVENGGDAGPNGSGGSVAAPIAQRVLEVFLGG